MRCHAGRIAAFFTFILLSGAAHTQDLPAKVLLVLSKQDHTLAIVDPANLHVVARVPVGDDPHEVIASADGKTAYVSNYGFGAFHTLAVVDLVAARPLAPVDLGALRGPHGLIFAGGETWFTAEAAKAIGRYDPVFHKVDLILGTGQNRTHMIYVSPDQKIIIATNVSSGTLSLFQQEPVRMPGPPPGPPGNAGNAPPPPPLGPGGDHQARMDWNQTIVQVGNGAEGFDVSPDLAEVWVANAQDGTISIVNVQTQRVTQTLDINARGANRLKFTPDGRTVLVSSGPELVMLDAASRSIKKRLPIGHGSGGVLVQPDGARAFVSCGPDNDVAVVDLRTLKVVGRINAGREPDGLAWAQR